MSKAKHRDMEKERHWQRIIRQAARSGKSIREFCHEHDLKESRFYWWQRKFKERRQEQTLSRRGADKSASADHATFALVSDEPVESLWVERPGALAAGIELVLSNGRRLRIGKGVDAETLRIVLTAADSKGC